MPAWTAAGIGRAPRGMRARGREKAPAREAAACIGAQSALRLAAGRRMRRTGGRRARGRPAPAAGAAQDSIGRPAAGVPGGREQRRRAGNARGPIGGIPLAPGGGNRPIQ